MSSTMQTNESKMVQLVLMICRFEFEKSGWIGLSFVNNSVWMTTIHQLEMLLSYRLYEPPIVVTSFEVARNSPEWLNE